MEFSFDVAVQRECAALADRCRTERAMDADHHGRSFIWSIAWRM